jgi:dienelactone hydrolase
MRRSIVRSLLAATLAAMPVVAAAEAVKVPATATTPEVPAYLAKPAGAAPAPAVVVLHGCEGYSDAYRGVADWLASHGYVALAIDALAPLGMRNGCTDTSTIRAEARDAYAALAWLRTQPYVDGTRLALLGYSAGAIATLGLVDNAALPNAPAGLRAAVAYYPACDGRDAANDTVPLRILDGSDDDWLDPAPCKALADAAAAAGKTIVITTYPGAKHAFNFPGPDRTAFGHHLGYDPKAAADAQAQTLAFLQQYLSAK